MTTRDEELSEIIEDEDGDKVQIEALLIANRIRSLMENGMVTDKKTGQLRAVQYRDIVILREVLQPGAIQWQQY